MAETAEKLLDVLQGIMSTNQQLADSLALLVQRQEAEHREFLKALERLSEHLQANTAHLQASTASLQANDRLLGEMLVRLGETLSRTEQMSAQILASAAKGAAH